MAKEQVQESLERDAYLSRKQDAQTSRAVAERLSKLMSLSEKDKAELMVYAE